MFWSPFIGIYRVFNVVLMCTFCFYSHTFEVCNYNYYHKKTFYSTSSRKCPRIFKGINETTNKSKKWKKQKIGLETLMRAVKKKRSRSWRNSSRIVKEWWTRVSTVLEMISPHSNKFEMVKNIKLTNLESTCKNIRNIIGRELLRNISNQCIPINTNMPVFLIYH